MSSKEIHQQGTDDGWHGVIEKGGEFEPEKDRYILYIGLFCPFAHRANLVRYLFGLTDVLPISVVKPYPKPWQFPRSDDEYPGATVDPLFGSKELSEIYFRADPEYKGKYSVPLLWDKKKNTIVNNESAELLRWLPDAFSSIVTLPPDVSLYPSRHREIIDKLTPFVQSNINSGVYKAGFAPNQEVYDAAIPPLFGSLNTIEKYIHKNGGPYILGKDLTELDLRLYATIVRFDAIYVQHFRCNLGIIRHDYPVLHSWLKRLYWDVPGFRESTNFKHIKENYTKSHLDINPKKITPLGPWPPVEEGIDNDWTKLHPGSIQMPEVLDYQHKFEKELGL